MFNGGNALNEAEGLEDEDGNEGTPGLPLFFKLEDFACCDIH